MEHQWINKYEYPTCGLCGIVRRTDGKNNPCKGFIKIGIRELAEKHGFEPRTKDEKRKAFEIATGNN